MASGIISYGAMVSLTAHVIMDHRCYPHYDLSTCINRYFLYFILNYIFHESDIGFTPIS